MQRLRFHDAALRRRRRAAEVPTLCRCHAYRDSRASLQLLPSSLKDLLRSAARELHIKGLRWARALHFFSRLSAASDGTDLNFAAN
jgi:hypothetical protein